jgi:hypothetical protein
LDVLAKHLNENPNHFMAPLGKSVIKFNVIWKRHAEKRRSNYTSNSTVPCPEKDLEFNKNEDQYKHLVSHQLHVKVSNQLGWR